MRQADSKIASLAGLDVHDRVASLLHDLSENREGRRVVSRRISRADIARMVGASREMVSRVMRDLQVRGQISEADGVIRLHGESPRDMPRAA
jgi:CRP/FNR family cyclic AMP-dependent transcriptional regulator